MDRAKWLLTNLIIINCIDSTRFGSGMFDSTQNVLVMATKVELETPHILLKSICILEGYFENQISKT